MRRTVVAATLLLMLAGSTGAQDTTGRIVVRAVDEAGIVVAGVAVTVASPGLIGGPRTEITDPRGEARHLLLAPGVYTVTASQPGRMTQERTGVKVPLGGAAVLTVPMVEAAFEGEIEVSAETPVVDPTQVAFEQVLDETFLDHSAVATYQRLYVESVNQVAGVRSNRVMGSTVNENAWYVDGVDTTDPSNGAWGISVIYDSIEEMEVSSAGFEASHGRALGGVINVVTRSGGNRFAGTADVRYRDEGFYEDGDHYDRDDQQESATLIDATLGGPIIRDRLWFFTALRSGGDRVRPVGSPVEVERTLEMALAKLTWQAAPSWRAMGSFSPQQLTFDDYNASRFITADAAASEVDDIGQLSLAVDSVPGDAWVWDLRVGRYTEDVEGGPSSDDLTTPAHVDLTTGRWSSNFPRIYDQKESRTDIGTSATWFTEAAGSHEIEGGVGSSWLDLETAECYTGRSDSARCATNTTGVAFEDLSFGGSAVPFRMWEETTPGSIPSSGQLWSLYLQDAWRPVPSLTVKAGVRWDHASYDNDTTTEIAALELWQPRLGAAWDLSGAGRTVVRASVGRFMDPKTMVLPSFVASRSNSNRIWLSCSLAATGQVPGVDPFDPAMCSTLAGAVGIPWRTDPEGWDPFGWLLTGTQSQLPPIADPGLDAPYADHLVVSVEHALRPRTSLELSWISKRTDRLMEDTCNGNLDGPFPGHNCSRYVVANLPGLERSYDGAVLRVESRTLDWLTLLASYTWSESTGNVETLLAGYDFDFYPWHWENREGTLTDHRRHALRLNGFVLLPWDVTVSVNAGWSSAFPWTPRASPAEVPEMPYGELFVEPRGNRTGEDEWWLDLQVSKGFQIGSVRLEGIVAVANVFSSEGVTAVCERVSGCGGVVLGEPIEWQFPRRWEVGLRVEF